MVVLLIADVCGPRTSSRTALLVFVAGVASKPWSPGPKAGRAVICEAGAIIPPNIQGGRHKNIYLHHCCFSVVLFYWEPCPDHK